jgi:cyclohexa-1,5-dienecarbonyl-CoA hydratase
MASQTVAQYARISVTPSVPAIRIVLNSPPLNVIDIPMMEELGEALAQIETRSDISVVVISGEGKNFSAGVDVAAHTPNKVESMLGKFHTVIRALVSTRKATIAAVQGNCLGGGAELALVCDLVFTTETAQWGFPEIKLGCFPPVAATALATLIGQKQAADLILTGRTIDGSEAARIGLANRAAPGDQLSAAVDESVSRLATLSPAALAVTKKAIYAWDSMHFDKGLARAEKIYLDELMKTADAQEGIGAFLQKRQPRWMGK